MEVKTVEVYKCDHCAKKLLSKHAMSKHEGLCNKNPNNVKACHDCNFLTTVEMEVPFETGYTPDEGHVSTMQVKKVFKCERLNKLMYPWSIERKELPIKYPNTYHDQVAMPNKCNEFKEIEWLF